MASGLVQIPVGSQKHDPAWKHVQMFKNGDRIQLKCIYCDKLFSGGGIHRIKEHLAGQKGNASSCPGVVPEVRQLMQQSLNKIVVKRKKKVKIAEDIKNLNSSCRSEIDVYGAATQCEVNTGLQLIPVTNSLETDSGIIVKREEGVASESFDGRKRRKVSNSSPTPINTDALQISSNLTLESTCGKEQVHMAIGRFLYDAGAPLDSVNSVYFQPMIDAIASVGPPLELPSYHDFRGWILKNSVGEVKAILDQYKGSWGRTGCSVLADEWTSETGRILINFLVYCPEGMMFLKSVDVSNVITSTDSLYEVLKEVVEEVGIENVLQVITDSADHYIVAGKRLMETFPTMYWTPCAARCIDLMLQDISKFDWINSTLEHAKSVTRFIYNDSMVLNMMRRYTFGKDLIQPAVTRSATNFTTLQSMVNLKDNLQAMFTSLEWLDSPYAKEPAGDTIYSIISNQTFWSSSMAIIHLTDPLLRVLTTVSSHRRPAMGYIHERMYRAKEVIKKELVSKKDYLTFWKVIDHRWNQQLHCPLHAAGFYLNPRFFYSIEGDVHNQIMSGVLDCIERLIPEAEIQDKITKELSSYKNAVGDLGREMAIRARHTLLPAEWWSTYGGGCPNLARFAIRILSQTCCAIGCKRNHIPFEQIHYTRNCIEHQRLSDLVFVQYNLRLQKQQLQKNKEAEPMDPISFDSIETTEDWVVEASSRENKSSDWMALDQPVANIVPSGSVNDEDEDFVTGFEDDEIYNLVKDDEEDAEVDFESR